MAPLRGLVILAKSLVILASGMVAAAVVDSLLSETWSSVVVSISRLN
jgi:hypothetical protein